MLIRTQTSKLQQLSLPSSPISRTPKAINLHKFQSSDPVQSPQLARMMNNNMNGPKSCAPQDKLPYFVPVTSPVATKEEGKSYNEVVREISEFFTNFPVHSNDQMDRVNVGTTRESNLKVGSSSTSTTSRGHQRPLDGISMKLERFKIRTVQPGEVVKVINEERK